MNQIVTKQTSPIEKLLGQDNFKRELTKLMGDINAAQRMARIALTELTINPNLAKCDAASFGRAILKCAHLGLEPSSQMGYIHLIPFENKYKNITECQVIIGYKGMIALAYRSGEVKEIYAKTVYENDKFEVLLGTESYLKHAPALQDRGQPIAYYAYCKLINGGELKEILLPEDIEAIRKSSKTGNNEKSPWHTHFNAMSQKSCIRQIFDSLPSKSPQIHSALAHDSSQDLGKDSPILDLDGIEVVTIDEETGEILTPSPTKSDDLSARLETK